MLQHVATGWPNARNMLRPTMLGYVALNVAIVWPGLRLRALTILMEFSVISERIQMERFVPVENFRKKCNTSGGISFSSV